MQNEYEECYVAFIDILGFKEMLDKDDFNQIFNVFMAIKSFKTKPAIEMPAYNEIRFHIMSDSIIVYINSSVKDGFIALTDICGKIQMYLLWLDPPILVRGGIAQGTLYCKDDIIFGTGLSRAYLLENNLAVFPRIVFTEELLQSALKNAWASKIFDYNNSFYNKDEDELFFINFFDSFFYIKYLNVKSVEEVVNNDNEFFDKIINFVENKLAKETNSSIRQKYLWLKKKIYKSIDNKPEVKKHILEIQDVKKEQKNKEFEAILKGVLKK